MITNEQIKEILADDYNYLKTIYPQDRILGIFTYGKFNYGFAESIRDLQVKMYYIPSLEELCTNITFKDETVKYNQHTINVKDIRLILDNILNQENTAMECFFAENYIITPKFKTVYVDNILTKREEIFRCNPKKRVEQSVASAYESLQQYLKTNNRDYLFDACRKRLAIQLYLDGTPVEDCIHFKKDYHTTYLWSIKKGLSLPNMEEVTNDLEEIKIRAEDLEMHPELEDLVKNSIIEIVKIALTRTIDKKEFLQALTNIEKTALKEIMKYLDSNGEGVVSISKLIDDSGISRPVFKSVLNKMKDMEIAELTNMGAKGTQVKIIDGVFLNIDEYIN